MEKEVRIELNLEELNEIYYVLGKTFLDKNLYLAKYEVVEQVLDKVRDKINNHA